MSHTREVNMWFYSLLCSFNSMKHPMSMIKAGQWYGSFFRILLINECFMLQKNANKWLISTKNDSLIQNIDAVFVFAIVEKVCSSFGHNIDALFKALETSRCRYWYKTFGFTGIFVHFSLRFSLRVYASIRMQWRQINNWSMRERLVFIQSRV